MAEYIEKGDIYKITSVLFTDEQEGRAMKRAYLEMEMPENCTECQLLNDDYFCCQVDRRSCGDDNIIMHRPDWCPLQELTEHGELIDRDETIKTITKVGALMEEKCGFKASGPYIAMALYLENRESFPTVIPADHIRDITKMIETKEKT